MFKENTKICCFLWLGIFFSFHVFAQRVVTVSGTVNDDKGTLPGATVFLTGTKYITATNLSGDFKFSKVPPGNYSLIVKMMGYSPFLKQIMVGEEDVNLNILLKVSTAQLSEVVIKPNTKEWYKNLELFKAQFLGENANAKQCQILNAEVLDLDYNKERHILKAGSEELLKIENKALGYRLTYLLINFEYDSRKNTVVYQGYPSFENMAGTPEEEAAWKEKRATAYQGSIQHFISSLYNNDTKQQGFMVYELAKWTPGGNGYVARKDSLVRKRRVDVDTMITSVNKNYKKFGFSRALFVVYLKQKEDIQYQANGYSLSTLYNDKRLDEGQSSIINLEAPSVVIDAKGAFYKPQDLFFEGYMGWQKIANLTPFGFNGGS
ncbi:carboxypeptidase-like regulatory domain-containing protein [Mucilaginibacter sp. ZT4R22]|uniref:Carboxypeptidase-like regulatory domain-containing protein n=1 Tax=Mucilaginibacter pankratovii TaxID=2772110 RepID=A0ABR7WU66_9SPHI|nr:carboxypeptidase-like regulatory domain-containing protein [Mucilaginibacter pankratovii]MBD1365830.1 carboxypeptidase-like regulatory domain-containing protein [Mucilaginibacter pankratovii]